MDPLAASSAAAWATAVSRSRASARSTDATTSTVPVRSASRRCTTTWRASAAATRRSSASTGSKVSRASWHSRSVCTTPTLCATGASRRSTKAAPAIGRAWVCSAIRAARHHCRSPAATRRQISGSRYRTSSTRPTYRRQASTVMPNAVASSITANSDTHGAPGPASASPVSRPNSTSVAASSAVTWWAAQYSTTCPSIRTSAASRSARSARTASRRVTCGSPSNSSTVAAAMTPIQPATTDTRRRLGRCCG